MIAYNLKHMLKCKVSIILVALLTLPLFTLAQGLPQERTLSWGDITRVKISDTKQVTELGFLGARYDLATGDLPVYKERFRISSPNFRVEARITNQTWADLQGNITG